MKAITVFLVVTLLLVGIAVTALPMLSAALHPSQPATPIFSISPELASPVFIACDPPPCDCTGDGC